MRIYLGGVTRPELKQARQLAPSHVFGATWTPHDRRLNYVPFFVDNGAFTDSFDPDEWVELLDDLANYNYGPDFVVLPDVLNDAEETLERHRQYAPEVLNRGLPPAAVIQPGMDAETQVRLAERIGAKFVFVGGETRWQRAFGQNIVEEAHALGMAAHIGNPSGEDGLVWAYRTGFDSADTSTVTQNSYWHYVECLEEVTVDHSNRGSLKREGRQATLFTDGGRRTRRSVGTDTEQP